jgi:hypothetical protein
VRLAKDVRLGDAERRRHGEERWDDAHVDLDSDRIEIDAPKGMQLVKEERSRFGMQLQMQELQRRWRAVPMR